MTGTYLEVQIRGYIIGPVTAFGEYIFTDVLPTFANLDQRADKMASDHYNKIGSQPAWEDCCGDMGAAADDAHDKALSWYQMMTSLRQSMLNLLAAGLFHLTEQRLALVCRDASFMVNPPRETKLEEVKQWYAANLRLDLETLPSWPTINELRLVSNAVKHAEGPATRQLRTIRPELFSDPAFEELYKKMEEDGLGGMYHETVSAPLSGEEFFVSEKLLKEYAEAAKMFFREIADHFQAHADEYY